MTLPDNIKTIVIDRLLGNTGPEDAKTLEEQQCQQEEQGKELSGYDKVWTESGQIFSTANFDVAKAWQCVDKRLNDRVKKEVVPGRIVNMKRYIKVAVIALFVMAGGWMLFRPTADPATWEKVTAELGNEYVRLPDSSTVLLRKGATISYVSTFGRKNREIALTGDAFFNIAENENLPFAIQTERTHIKVLGTSFVVNNTGKADRIVVVTGKVLCADKARPENQCVLTAKETASFSGQTFEKGTVNDNNYLAWQTGIFRFSNAILAEVVKELSAYYGKTVLLSEPSKTGNIKVTASFREQPLQEVIGEITVITGLHFKQQEDSITIY